MAIDPPFSADAKPPAVVLPLTALSPGRCGWVVDVEAGGDDTERLKVMGICAGRKVRLVRRGDPMILCVWGTRVGVSRRLAEQVYVQPCQGSPDNLSCRHPLDHVAAATPAAPLARETLN